MSGNYPDGVSQSEFDAAHDEMDDGCDCILCPFCDGRGKMQREVFGDWETCIDCDGERVLKCAACEQEEA